MNVPSKPQEADEVSHAAGSGLAFELAPETPVAGDRRASQHAIAPEGCKPRLSDPSPLHRYQCADADHVVRGVCPRSGRVDRTLIDGCRKDDRPLGSTPFSMRTLRPALPMLATRSSAHGLSSSRSISRDGRLNLPSTPLSESQPPPNHSRGPPIWWYIADAPDTRAARRAFRPCGTRLNPITQSGRIRRATTAHVTLLCPPCRARPAGDGVGRSRERSRSRLPGHGRPPAPHYRLLPPQPSGSRCAL